MLLKFCGGLMGLIICDLDLGIGMLWLGLVELIFLVFYWMGLDVLV